MGAGRSLTPVISMVALAAVSWFIARAVVDAGKVAAVSWGMAGPLAVAVVAWVLTDARYRRNRSGLTSLLTTAFAVKMVFFGMYVVVMLKVLTLPPIPFVASFVAYFIALHLMEALFLQRLLSS
jgi:hypothetical protein